MGIQATAVSDDEAFYFGRKREEFQGEAEHREIVTRRFTRLMD